MMYRAVITSLAPPPLSLASIPQPACIAVLRCALSTSLFEGLCSGALTATRIGIKAMHYIYFFLFLPIYVNKTIANCSMNRLQSIRAQHFVLTSVIRACPSSYEICRHERPPRRQRLERGRSFVPIGRRGGASEGVRECGRAAECLGGRARAVTWGETQFFSVIKV